MTSAANHSSNLGPRSGATTRAAGLARGRRLLALALLVLLAAAGPASAGEPSAPTLSKVFTPNVIGPGGVSTATFTITNFSPFPVTGVAFTDTLPAAITIADPANASTDCDLGTSGTLTAPDGGSTITLSDAQIGASSSCTITVDVTASTAGAHTNPAVTLTSSAGSSMSLAVDLTVDTMLPGFSKSFAPGSVSLGGKSTLTFTIDNSANPTKVDELDFTDQLPTGMAVADPANASTTCGTATIPPTLTANAGAGFITLDANGIGSFPALAAGATCTVTVDVVTTAGGMLDNVSGELLANFVSAGKASATLEVTITALAIRKSFTDDPVPPGGTVTLEFRIDNFDRIFPATGVAFTDDLTSALAGLTFDSVLFDDCGGSVSGVGTTTIGLSGGTIAAESFCTLRVSLTVPAGATPGAYTNTSGAVSGTVDGLPVVGNAALEDLFVEPVPVLTKEFLEVGTLAPDPVVEPGDDVVIRFTVANTSATSGATDVAFFDELTDGSGGFPPDPTSGFLPFPVSVTLPPVPDPPCGAGSSLALSAFDTDRQRLQLTGGSLAAAGMAGDSCTFDVTVTIPAALGAGIYTNTTEAPTATVDGATRTGLAASDTLTVVAAPQLTKEFLDDPVAPGGTVTLEFTLEHSADASGDATGITFTDDLSFLAGLTANLPPTPDPPCGAGSTLTGSAGDTLLTLMGGTLMPGETCAFSVTLDVPPGASPGSYLNATSGVGATVDGVPASSPAASDILAVAGLIFSKEFLGDPVIAGDTVTLKFTIDNIHPTDDATITFFTDNLAAELAGLAATGPPSMDTCGGALSGTTFLTYIGGGVLSGLSCTIEVEVLVPLGTADDDYLNVTSSLSANQMGAVTIPPATDLLSVSSTLLELTKEFTDDPVAPGDPVTLELTLTNLDAANAASGVGFTDDLSALVPALPGLTFDSVLFDDCGGTVGGTGTAMVTVSGVSLAASASCTVRVSVTVPGGAAAGVYTNTTSEVTGTIGGFAVTGDPASDDLEVTQILLFSKAFDGPTTATGTAILTFTITNPGGATATGIGFTDDLGAVIPGLIAISLPAVPCGAGSSITGIGFLTFSGGELPPAGGMCSFDVEVLVPVTASGGGSFPNVTSELFQFGLPVADPATADLDIEPAPLFSKVFAPDAIGPGGVSTLTFTIDNTASIFAATALDFTDVLPAGLVIATPPGAATTCAGGTLTAVAGSDTIVYTGGSVPAGASCTVVVDVTTPMAGSYHNTSGDLTSSSGNSGPANDTLMIVAADLELVKEDLFEPVMTGRYQVYTLTVTNLGPATAETVELTDVVPAGAVLVTPEPLDSCGEAGGIVTCAVGDLHPHESFTATIMVYVELTETPTPLENMATVTSTTLDPDPGNNDVMETTEVIPRYGLVALDDVDGNLFPEVAVPLPGSIDLLVKDSSSLSVLHQTELFPDGWVLAGFEKAPMGNVAVMAVEVATGAAAVQVVAGLDGSPVSTAVIPAGFLPTSLAVILDDGAGRTLLVVGAVRTSNLSGWVMAFNASTGNLVGLYSVHPRGWPVAVSGVASFAGGPVAEVGVVWVNRVNGRKKLWVQSLNGFPRMKVTLPMEMSPLGLTTVADCCGGPSDELAALGWDRLLDKVRVETVESDGGLPVNSKLFGTGGQPAEVRALGDDLATLYRNGAPRAALRVFDTATGANVVNAGEIGGSVPLGLGVSADAYGTPADDVSVFWLDPGSGVLFVTVRDGAGGVVAGVPIP